MVNISDVSLEMFPFWSQLASQLFGFPLPVKEAVLTTTDMEFTVLPTVSMDLTVDLWDLGEFDQKGTTRTKWGTRDDLITLANIAQEKKIKLYFDAVLNHKAGADEREKCRAIICDWDGAFSGFTS